MNHFLRYKNENALKRLSGLLNVPVENVTGEYLAVLAKSTLEIVRKIKGQERN